MPTIARYGSWKSPITSELIVAQSIALSETRLDGDACYWLEGRPQEGWAAIGIGLNVGIARDEFPEELRDTATSMLIATGADPGVEPVLAALLGSLEQWLAARPAAVLAAWRERDVLAGRPIKWNGGEGTAAGIDDYGALLADTRSGRVALDAGEVHLQLPDGHQVGL